MKILMQGSACESEMHISCDGMHTMMSLHPNHSNIFKWYFLQNILKAMIIEISGRIPRAGYDDFESVQIKSKMNE